MKRTTKKRSAQKLELPPALIAIASLASESESLDALATALDAARADVRSAGDYPNHMHAFIEHYALSGAYKKDVELAMEKDIDMASLHNAFATPALLCGMALAYVVLRDAPEVQ